MFVRRLFAADADTSGGTGPESTETDSPSTADVNADPAQSAAGEQSPTTSSTTPIDKDKARKVSERIKLRSEQAAAAERAKVGAKLLELGVDYSDGDDVYEKLAELHSRSQATTQQATEIERAQQKAAKLDLDLQKERATRQAYVEDTEFKIAVQRYADTVDASMVPDIRASFFATYRIRQTDAGVRVYDKAGSPVETDDGDDMTPDEVFAAFIAARPHFQKAQARSAAGTSGTAMKGTTATRTVSNDDLRSGRLTPEELIKGDVRLGG
jgi:hypothetical protein